MSTGYQSPDFKDVLKYFIRNWKALFGIPFAIAVIVAIYTLFIPNKYRSTANLLPSQRPSIGLDLFSESGGLSSIASSVLGGESEEANRYIVLLSSFSTNKKVVEKFDLTNQYEVQGVDDPLNEAIKILADRTSFENMEEGNFIISVLDENPEQAKQMADFYVVLLNELNTSIVSRDAKQYREFLEKRYLTLLDDIDSLKTEYIDFQNRYGVFELPEQVKEYFNIIGLLTAQQLESEVKLEILSASTGTSSSVYATEKRQYDAISKKIDELYNDDDPKNLILNFNNLAQVGTEYYDLFFQLEVQQEIQKFLLPLYEQAKMEEAKSLPIVTVVDEPRVPLIKSEPRRSIIVILTGISAFILVLAYLLLRLSYIRNKDFIHSLKN